MTRKRRRELREAQGIRKMRASRKQRTTRMSRAQLRQLRDQQQLERQMVQAAAASLSSIYVLQSITPSQAASLNTFADVPSYFNYMRDARDRIRNHYALLDQMEEAQKNRRQAQQYLQEAVDNYGQAEENLLAAEHALDNADVQISKLRVALGRANAVSEHRTRTALASQQAVAEYLPQYYAQQAVVDSMSSQVQLLAAEVQDLSSQRDGMQAELDAEAAAMAGSDGSAAASALPQPTVNNPQERALANFIENTWRSVDYEQNRLYDVQRIVEDAASSGSYAAKVDGAAGTEAAASADPRQAKLLEKQTALDDLQADIDARQEVLDSQQAELDDQQSLLDEMESELDSLRDAQSDAEEAEAEARQDAADLAQDLQMTIRDRQEAETYLQEAKQYVQEADAAMKQAETDAVEADRYLAEVQHSIDHFGEGSSFGTGMEYYSWRGAASGHQLYMPLEVSQMKDDLELMLSTGYVSSSSGMERGNVSGWTDTTIGAILHNDNEINDVRYSFIVNAPTGRTGVNQNAYLTDDLARYTSFGEGWGFSPGISATHRFTERDSITGRMRYTWRGSYDYKYDWFEDMEDGMGSFLGRRFEERRAEVHPGNLWWQEAEYLHAGEHEQFLALLSHQSASRTVQDGIRYTDGDEWMLKLFHSQDFTDMDSWQAYAAYTYTGRTRYHDGLSIGGSQGRKYLGLGWTHEIDKDQRLRLMLNYMDSNGESYDPITNQASRDRKRLSVQLSYRKKLDEVSQLVAHLERYTIRDRDSSGYHGWSGAIMYYRGI